MNRTFSNSFSHHFSVMKFSRPFMTTPRQRQDNVSLQTKVLLAWNGRIYQRDSKDLCRCTSRKTGGGRSATLVNITSSSPMQIVCLDYFSLERSKGGEEHILAITDHFARYVQVIPTKKQIAKTTAKVLFDNFIVHYASLWLYGTHSQRPRAKLRVEADQGALPVCQSREVNDNSLSSNWNWPS